jgi:AcrR family transcriptional regulator
MSKGERTREAILDHALDLASVVGLEGLSIGALASHSGLSKSGLFAHFGSKEALQLATLKAASAAFVGAVMGPARAWPQGVERLRAIFENWLAWTERNQGGCLFVTAAVELDDREGAAREFLVAQQRSWLDALARQATYAARTGELRADLDGEQFAFEMYGLYLGYHNARRLQRDPDAARRARAAFETLVANAR